LTFVLIFVIILNVASYRWVKEWGLFVSLGGFHHVQGSSKK
jgi:hypothetical protein